MTNTLTTPDLSREVTASFVAALGRRDFAGLAALVSPDAPIRALTPMGLATGTGPAFLEERFSTWFGGDDAFAVEDTTVATAGQKVHLCWRIAMTAPEGAVRKAEQHTFVRVSDRIDSLDLVCSGYWPVAS
ncbi:MAG TPA: nuclear transport factor 2 family protein [Nocardioides sp.]|nr:nuclear transport factor 2 family protein [Nocardioides sp.]